MIRLILTESYYKRYLFKKTSALEINRRSASSSKFVLALVIIAVIVVAGAGYYFAFPQSKPAQVTLTVYGAVDAADMQTLLKDFQGNYSWITVNYQEMTPPVAYSRVTSELAGNKSTADLVFMTNSLINLMKGKGLLGSYNSSQLSNYPSRFYDAGGHWAAAVLLPVVISYNTQSLNSSSLPSLLGLSDPAWKGKITMLDPTLGSTGTQYLLSLVPSMGNSTWTSFMQQLETTAQPAPNSDTTAIASNVASGQYQIGIFTYLHDVLKLQSTGAHIGWYLPKLPNGSAIPLLTAPESLALIKGTPHLQAAQLFEDFVLSKGGQQILGNTATRIPSLPGTTAKYTLESAAPGAKVVFFPTPQVSASAAAWGKKFKAWGY